MAADVTSLLVGGGPLVAGIVGIVVLVYALAVCVCGDKGNKNPVSDGKYKPASDSAVPDADEKKNNSVAIDIDRSVTPLEDGLAPSDDLKISITSQKSPGHSPHHANHRQLPAPPSVTGNGNLSTSVISRVSSNKEDEDNDGEDDYDHLNDDRKPNRLSNYDHVVLDADGKVQVKERKIVADTEYAEVNLGENIYTPVKDNGASNVKVLDDYSKVKDVVSSTRVQQQNINYSSGDPEDPYALVSDDEKDVATDSKGNEFYAEVKEYPYNRVKGDKEDPYAKVKGDKDDPYAKVKGDKDDPYAKVKGDKDDPYTKVKGDKDDPYSKVRGDKEDPYNKVKEPGDVTSSDDSDPYNKVKEDDDDPYNSVSEDEIDRDQGDDPYNKIKTDVDPYNKVRDDLVGARPKVRDPYAFVDPNRKRDSIKVTRNSVVNGESKAQEFLVEESADEYAVVMKNRSETPTTVSSGAVHSPSVDSDQYQLPPEPPRNYRGDGSSESGDPVSNTGSRVPTQGQSLQSTGDEATAAAILPTNEVAAATQPLSNPPPQDGEGVVVRRKEPPYIKLTSRESMASINARRAQNTYETVVETENMYATVEGGSGDGVVRPAPTPVVKTSPPKNRQSQPNDFYTEIGASGGSHPKVPAPPSLDSLHMMTKAHPDVRQGSRSSAEESDLRPLSDLISSPGSYSNNSENVSSARHSLDLHSFNGAVGGTSEGHVKLDPNYQTVRDNINNDLDIDCDTDPNYESVDEAKAKISKFEIKSEDAAVAKKRLHLYEEVKPAPSSETTQARSRALRSHMYEDINEVQEQKKELNRKSQELERKELNRKSQDIEKKKSGKKK